MVVAWFCLAVLLLIFAAFEAIIGRDRPEDEIVPPTEGAVAETPEEMHPQEEPRWTACVTDEDIRLAAQTVWGEARGIESQMEQAAVVWTMLNRVDEWGETLGEVVTAPHQFQGYNPDNPTVDDFGRDLEALVRAVVARWEREHNGEWGVGRVLPKDYLFFGAENGHNHFRREYDSFSGIWSWGLPNPYEN